MSRGETGDERSDVTVQLHVLHTPSEFPGSAPGTPPASLPESLSGRPSRNAFRPTFGETSRVPFRNALQGCHQGGRSRSNQRVDSLISRVKVLQCRNDSAVTRTRVFMNSRGASTSNSTPKSSKQNNTFAEHSEALTCKNHALADRSKKMPLESCEASHSASLCLTLLAGASLRTWKQAGNNMV